MTVKRVVADKAFGIAKETLKEKKRLQKIKDNIYKKYATEDKDVMPFEKKVPEISESGTLTMEQWAAQKPQKKFGESKKAFGKRHRAWINRRPKI